MPESLRQLHANCGALAARDPRLAEIVLSARPSGGFSSERARTGHLVPLVHREGSGVYLHSRYDPVREAARRTVEWEGAGFLVAIGLGGGFHIDAMLHSRGVGLVVVVEKDASVLRTLFSLLPLEALLESPRVILANGPSDAGQKVLQFWHPALAGSLSAATLGPWCALERTFCQAASDAVRKAVETVRADYSVQAHFGKRWFLNMVRNLPRALPPEARPPLPKARVVAAGPSLDLQMPHIASASAEGTLVATDTSLPALRRAGISPDIVLSIDCQHYSYHHFLQGMAGNSALYLDLASPPLLSRLFPHARFVAGNHPFAAYLCDHWHFFPRIDMTGGNVTHAAVSLTLALGARDVTLYGADYSYPRGKPYARGTYIFEILEGAASRLHPLESLVHGFVLRARGTRSEQANGHLRYSTEILTAYRDAIGMLARGTTALIHSAPGEGLPIETDPDVGDKDALPADRRATFGSPGPPTAPPDRDWRGFLLAFADALTGLPAPGDPPALTFVAASAQQRELWATVVPVAASVARELGNAASLSGNLHAAREWMAAQARRQVLPGGT